MRRLPSACVLEAAPGSAACGDETGLGPAGASSLAGCIAGGVIDDGICLKGAAAGAAAGALAGDD